jgi:hypothetical protein
VVQKKVGRDRRYLQPFVKTFDRALLGNFTLLDGRTHQYRLARDLTAELVDYLGNDPTLPQRLLIERIVKLTVHLDKLEERMTAGDWTAHYQQAHTRLSNSHRLAMRELEKMKPRDRAAEPGLEDLVELHQQRSRGQG